MPVETPERTYGAPAVEHAPYSRDRPEGRRDEPARAPQSPRRRRGPAPLMAFDGREADAYGSEDEGTERRGQMPSARTRRLQAGRGNGYLAAAVAARRDEEPGAVETGDEAPPEAADRAERKREEAHRSDEPEYAESVSLERPETGTAAPEEEPAAVGAEAAALEEEAAADEGEAMAAGVEGEEAVEGEEEEKEQEEQVPEGDEALAELDEEEGAAEEKAGGPEGEEGAAAEGAAESVPAGVQSAQGAVATLATAAGSLTDATQRPIAFAPHPEEASNSFDVASRGASKRRASEALADEFIGRNAHHAGALLTLASTAPLRIIAASEAAKASIDATVATNVATVTAGIASALASVQQEAAVATALIQAQRAVTLVTITTATIGARTEVETLFTTVDAELTSLETTQSTAVSAQYRSWQPTLENVGNEIGDEGLAVARRKGNAWLAMRNGESSILDGPIHDNRLEARADAAVEVAEAYKGEFDKAAKEQAGQVMAGETDVLKYVTDSAAQARDGLTQHRDAILDALTQSETGATDQVNQLADQMVEAIATSLATTTSSLLQQQVAQVARLGEYGLSQKTAIDDQSGQAIAALLEGGAAAVDGFSQSIREFLDTSAAMSAPEGEELGPALATVQAQTDGLAATMLAQMEQGIAASEQGVIAGGMQAADAVNQIGQSAVEQASAAAAGYAESAASMLQQALDGFAQLRDGHQETADAVKASASEGFTQAATSLREAFSQLSTTSTQNFTDARDQMRAAFRESLPALDTAIEEQAEKAADAVQPRWKSVLKWVITIVVIVAVVALTIVSAGALGVVGTIVLGAALGAAAGAVTTIGHNLVDGKEWSEGVGKAMVVGAIGGAFGGIGGAIAGKVASVGLKFAIETGVDVVGGIVGDLAVGNTITVQGVLFGAAIGAGVGAGVGLASALKGKIRLRPRPPAGATPNVTVGAPPRAAGPKSRTREFLERTTILKKTPDVDVATPAAPHPRGTADAGPPAARAETPSPARVDAPAARVEAPAARVDAPARAETPTARADAPAAKPEVDAPGGGKRPTADEPELGVRAKSKSPDGKHQVKVTESGRVVTCTTCAEVRVKFKDELSTRPNLARRLDDIEVRAKSTDPVVAKGAADDAAALEQTLRTIREGNPEVALGGKTVSSRKELEAHLDAIAKSGDPLTAAKRQELVDLAERLGREVNSGQVSADMRNRLEALLKEFEPHNLAKNPVLKEAWDRTLLDISKNSKKFAPLLNADGTIKPNGDPALMKELYAFARGKINDHLDMVAREIDDAFGMMKARVTNLPLNVELHHLLYKAKVPAHAVTPENIILALRKKGGAEHELHDLFHFISSGAGITAAGKNRWRTLLTEMEDVIRKVYGL